MNILYYIPDLSQHWGGVRQYAVALLEVLAQDTKHTYFILHNSGDPEVMRVLKTSPQLNLLTTHTLKSRLSDVLKDKAKFLSNTTLRRIGIRFQFKFEIQINRICRYYKIDVIHCPYRFIPATRSAKLIPTMHDFQELYFPEYFSAQARANRAEENIDYLFRADKIVVSYNHVKQDILKFFAEKPEKIHVILLDMGNLWFRKFLKDPKADISKLDLPSSFLLYPANTWPHKNHLGLLRAVHHLKKYENTDVTIVCTGSPDDFYTQCIMPLQEELGLLDKVRFVGIVDEQTLYSLYHSCLGVVIPTTYEAGSFPLIESILMHVPVICANVTSLPETVADERFLFDPFNIPQMAEKIKQLWMSEDFRSASVANSYCVEKNLTDSGTLKKVVDMYEAVAN